MPWPTDIAAAETVCAMRKPRFSRPGLPRRKIHVIAIIARKPKIRPTTGEITIGIRTFEVMVPHWTVPCEGPTGVRLPTTRMQDVRTASLRRRSLRCGAEIASRRV